MEFITVEQFKEQPNEVQEVFLDWWGCEWGDLYIKKKMYDDKDQFTDVLCVNALLEGDIEGEWEYFKDNVYPLFTEGQLRKFIEDKAKCKVMIEYTSCENIVIKICKQDEVTGSLRCKRKVTIPNNKFDLITSYWKVACKIAKEEL